MNVSDVLTRAYGGQTQQSSGELTSFDVNQFLNLLIAEMRYQNPLEPKTEGEYLQEMAQVSTVQELRDLNQELAYATQTESIANASSFIGKTIEGKSYLDGSPVSGVVSAVTTDGNATLLVVGDNVVAIGDVTAAYTTSAYDALSDAASLMGREVAGVDASDGQTVVSGNVVSVKTDGGAIYLEIEGQDGKAHIRADRLLSRGSDDPAEELVAAAWLIGHTVEIKDPSNPGQLVSGAVDGLALEGGRVYVSIGGTLYKVTDIQKVVS
jgi:flagellar basal-body rod modification protein FlgD